MYIPILELSCVSWRKYLQNISNKRIGIVQSVIIAVLLLITISSLETSLTFPSKIYHMLTIVAVVLRTFCLCRDTLTNVYRIVRKCTILIFADCLSFSFQFMYICFRSSASIINIKPLNPSHSYIVFAMLNVWQKDIKVSSRKYLESIKPDHVVTSIKMSSFVVLS